MLIIVSFLGILVLRFCIAGKLLLPCDRWVKFIVELEVDNTVKLEVDDWEYFMPLKQLSVFSFLFRVKYLLYINMRVIKQTKVSPTFVEVKSVRNFVKFIKR